MRMRHNDNLRPLPLRPRQPIASPDLQSVIKAFPHDPLTWRIVRRTREIEDKKVDDEVVDAVKDLTEFKYFPKLPAEIRVMIYKYIAGHPHVQRMRILSKKSQWWKPGSPIYTSIRSIGKLAPIFEVCHEAREEAFNYFALQQGKCPIRFRVNIDVFYFPYPLAMGRKWDVAVYQKYARRMFLSGPRFPLDVPNVTLQIVGGIVHIALDLATIAPILRLPRVSNPHLNTHEFQFWVQELPCRLPRLESITLFWSAHDMKQVPGDNDKSTFPKDWPKEINKAELNMRIKAITRYFKKGIDNRDGVAIHLYAGLTCARTMKHSDVKVLLVQKQRIGFKPKPVKEMIRKVQHAVECNVKKAQNAQSKLKDRLRENLMEKMGVRVRQ